jgi:hypothetical protein
MLAESMALGKDGGHIGEPADQPYSEGNRSGCACVAVPRLILPEDATEPKTGIKFPTLLEDNSNLSTEVILPTCFCKILFLGLLDLFNFHISVLMSHYSA